MGGTTRPLMRLYIHTKKKRSATAGPLLTGPPGKLPELPMANPPLGLESTGSEMDLVIRLKVQMKSRSAFDKVFQKVWGASGKLMKTQKDFC